jgi:hypothetical protein
MMKFFLLDGMKDMEWNAVVLEFQANGYSM